MKPDNATTVIYDQHTGDALPGHFRASSGDYKLNHAAPPARDGLDTLCVSGSEQPSIKGIEENIKRLAKRVILVDLRQESHGFVNGVPMSWYGQKNWANKGLGAAEVMDDEARRLAALPGTILPVELVLAKDDEGRITQSRTDRIDVRRTDVESDVAARLGLGYERFAVTDHSPPESPDIARFVDFFDSLQRDAWLHFHCHAGDGRTTFFMLLCDILRNARKLSLEDLALRQYLLGGVDLLNHSSLGYKAPLYQDRAARLREFYAWRQGRPSQVG